MATKILCTTDQTIHELEVISDGQDFLADAIGNADYRGWWTTDRDDVAFEMNADDLAWWERWSSREQRIIDAANERGEEAIEAIAKMSTRYNDMEDLQDALEVYLGI